MKSRYVIKGNWDGQECYYVSMDFKNTLFGIHVIKLSTSIDEAMLFDSTDAVQEAYEKVSHVNFKIYPVCPICGEAYSEPPAISRKGNKSKICSKCGIRKTLEIFEINCGP